jgi:hypothetical protein
VNYVARAVRVSAAAEDLIKNHWVHGRGRVTLKSRVAVSRTARSMGAVGLRCQSPWRVAG